ncbi:MAG: hypothetical protein WBA44_08920 [Mesorhizobium sp.]
MRELLLAGVVAAAFGGLAANQAPQSNYMLDESGGTSTERTFVLQSASADCELRHGPADVTGNAALTVEKACSDALPALADATRWMAGSDGLVVLANGNGDALVEFAPTDGEGLETFQQGVPPAFLREIR